jgi:uncharacterized protein YndB with AHSA1/START domain
MKAVIENTGEIARTPEDVFDYLSDMANEIAYNPDCVSMKRLTDGPVGVGTKYRAKWKQSPGVIITECTQHERPRVWTYVNGGPISVTLTVTLEPTATGGTRMTSRSEWSPHGWFRFIFPIFVLVMRRAERNVNANARRALEDHRDKQVA